MIPLYIAAAEPLRKRLITPFKGEVSASNFITGDALALAMGVSAGSPHHSNAGWLHFVDPVDMKTKLVAKRGIRHSIGWSALNSAGVITGNRTITIRGKLYKVRLFKGANSNPATMPANSHDHSGSHGSEWNRLMYHISARPFVNTATTLTSEGIVEGDWGRYSEADLLTHHSHGPGAVSWCQELQSLQSAKRLWRGHGGVSLAYYDEPTIASVYYGWRPILELVE